MEGPSQLCQFPSNNNLERLLEHVDIEHMLEFETQIFLDIVQTDALVVAAKGINLELVVLNVLRVYCDPGNLVIVLNCSENEEKFFTTKMNSHHVHSMSSISSNTSNREEVYLLGGIHFITTRILVVDMLKKRIPIDKITGFVVFRAHSTLESGQEAFALRMFRQQNKHGFIKGFSNSAQSFTYGFGHVERVMKALFVKELFLWPRFHSLISKSFKEHAPIVIELHVPLSETLKKLQTSVLELMNLTIKELKRINKTAELQDITVEDCLTKKFHKLLQYQLDGIWHQLSSKSRQLVADLKTLRHLIINMLYADPVTFYATICSYRSIDYVQTATWTLFDAADVLFNQSSALVYSHGKELDPQRCPKWPVLLELLKEEIPREIAKRRSNNCDTTHTILILCTDNRTCYQIKEILASGPNRYLFYMTLKHNVQFTSISDRFKKCSTKSSDNQAVTVDGSAAEGSHKDDDDDDTADDDDFKCSYVLTMSQVMPEQLTNQQKHDKFETTDGEYIFETFDEMENLNLTQICERSSAPTVLVQTFNGVGGQVNLQRTLSDLKPSYVIMYHTNMAAVREIEMYEAHRKQTPPLLVYFLLHTDSIEEQSYLTSLRREKEAFEFLIETKSTMVIPEDQDGKGPDCLALYASVKDNNDKSTRQGGSGENVENIRPFIIVDMREFRSELPALLHKRGIQIEPVTIAIGDYILTNDICVERKSLSDLVGSLNSGRLYQQATQMCRFYSKPMLLIEFDQNKAFSWHNYIISSDEYHSFDVQQKLLLLTMHFPKLRIIWSPSPYASAELFEELKEGREQPQLDKVSTTLENDYELCETKYNISIYDFMIKLPGINTKNVHALLRQVNNLKQLVEKSEEELRNIMGNAVDAHALYSALHESYTAKEVDKRSVKGKGRYKPFFPKKS